LIKGNVTKFTGGGGSDNGGGGGGCSAGLGVFSLIPFLACAFILRKRNKG